MQMILSISQSILRYEISILHKWYMPVFTDGSKHGDRVSSAACCRGYTESKSLHGPFWVYTAEINALLIGLEIMSYSNTKWFLALSDSLPCTQALSNGNVSNPLLIQVLEELTALGSLGVHIVFCWIPSHIGIKGNGKVDGAAKAASSLEVEDLPLPYSDLRPYIRKYIQSQWKLLWDTQTGNKLHKIHPKIGLWRGLLCSYLAKTKFFFN